MSKSVYYCRFTGDYARDTSHLSLIQHGAYTVLLDFYYSSGKPLPPDMNALCRICRAFDDGERDAVSQVVSQFFELRGDGYHNKRADVELAYRAEQRDRLSKGAKKTNAKRWGKDSSLGESLSDTLGGRIPSPSPSPQPQKKEEKTNTAPAAHCDVVPVAVWLAFVEMRKKMRKPLTERAGELIRNKLRQLQQAGEDPIEVLEQSTMNSWAGVFSVKERGGNGKQTGSDLAMRNARALGLADKSVN